jgi:hypothetical protein
VWWLSLRRIIFGTIAIIIGIVATSKPMQNAITSARRFSTNPGDKNPYHHVIDFSLFEIIYWSI